jgi:hypothetical protein
MALSGDIKTILTANANLVSSVAARIYPCIAPENPTLPCVVYNLTGLQPTEHKGSGMSWDDCTLDITVLAVTLTAAETIGNYVRTAMNRYTGTISSDVVKSVNMTNQSWEPVLLTEGGSSTGYTAYACNSTWKVSVTQNISE